MRASFLALLLLTLLGLASCSSTPPRAPVPEGSWRLVSLDGASVPAEPALTLEVQADRVQGHGGVNRFSGPASFGPRDAFRAGPLVSTKRAGPPEENRRELRYLSRLQEAKRWSLVEGRLELADDERTLLVFER